MVGGMGPGLNSAGTFTGEGRGHSGVGDGGRVVYWQRPVKQEGGRLV